MTEKGELLTSHLGDTEFMALGFILSQTCLLQPFGEWAIWKFLSISIFDIYIYVVYIYICLSNKLNKSLKILPGLQINSIVGHFPVSMNMGMKYRDMGTGTYRQYVQKIPPKGNEASEFMPWNSELSYEQLHKEEKEREREGENLKALHVAVLIFTKFLWESLIKL